MKKVFFGLIATVMFSFAGNAQDSTNNFKINNSIENLYASNDVSMTAYNVENNNDIAVGRGKRIAGADAAGALGGAGSVASIAGWFSWTPAAPVAAIACGIGAIIGGVGCSWAASRMSGTNPKNPKDINLDGVSFSDNYFDQVGVLHNQILFDYYTENLTHSPKSFFEFINENKSKYGIKELYITSDYVEQQNNDIEKLEDIGAINEYTLANLPENVDKKNYSDFLNNLSDITDSKEAINFIKVFEGKELRNSKYNDKTKGILGGFFSTYRHSIALWY